MGIDVRKWCFEYDVVVLDEKSIPYGRQFRLEKNNEKINLNVYNTGKFLVQGKENSLKFLLSQHFSNPGKTKTSSSVEKISDPKLQHKSLEWIGIDESGKGDFFGPLVICAAKIKKSESTQILSLGVKDSKKMTDQRVKELAPQLQDKLEYYSVALMPEEYNNEYLKYKNLNLMLANYHAKCASKIFDPRTELVISDKFAHSDDTLNSAFASFEIPINKTIQVPRAEEDLAVACASVIARFHFVKGIEKLIKEFELDLPKGASTKVDEAAQHFVDSQGIDKLNLVAKTHFKTMDKLV
ncbi:MAG: ribonuclease HIII [Bdellovibrionales bacterium]